MSMSFKSRVVKKQIISSHDTSRPESELSDGNRDLLSTKDKIMYERNKKCTLPPPARSPFEEIKNLEAILAMEEAADLKKRNISKKIETEKTLADYMMTAK